MYVNFLSTYSDKKSCHTSTTLQTSIARFVSDAEFLVCYLLCGDLDTIFDMSSQLVIQWGASLFQNVFSESEMEGWRRHWCVLNNDQISLWDHPVAEIYKVAFTTQSDLSSLHKSLYFGNIIYLFSALCIAFMKYVARMLSWEHTFCSTVRLKLYKIV